MAGWTRAEGKTHIGRGATIAIVVVFAAALATAGWLVIRPAHHGPPQVNRTAQLAAAEWVPESVFVWLQAKRDSVDLHAEWNVMVEDLTSSTPGPFTSNSDVTLADVDSARKASWAADRIVKKTRASIAERVSLLTRSFAGERADAMVIARHETAAMFLADVANELGPLPAEAHRIDRTIETLRR